VAPRIQSAAMWKPLLALAAVVPVTAAAQVPLDPRSVGLAGAVRADPVANSALFGNPAGMARTYVYAAQAAYRRLGPNDTNSFGASIVDSKTQPSLAVGVGYAYEFADSGAPVEIESHDARMAFSHALIPNQAFLGMGLRYLRFDRPGSALDASEFTLDAGAVISLSPTIHLGVNGENLLQTDEPTAPRRAGGGLAYTTDVFVLDLDGFSEWSDLDLDGKKTASFVFAGGAELFLAEAIPFRLGVERHQGAKETTVSGGIGFSTASEGTGGSQLNVAFRKSIDVDDAFAFVAGFTLFL